MADGGSPAPVASQPPYVSCKNIHAMHSCVLTVNFVRQTRQEVLEADTAPRVSFSLLSIMLMISELFRAERLQDTRCI